MTPPMHYVKENGKRKKEKSDYTCGHAFTCDRIGREKREKFAFTRGPHPCIIPHAKLGKQNNVKTYKHTYAKEKSQKKKEKI